LFRNTGFGEVEETGQTPVFGQGNPALTQANGKEPKDILKKRKPKNNMVKTNSSFVSRVIPHDNLTKRLNEHSLDGIYAFGNVSRSFQWLDLSAGSKVRIKSNIMLKQEASDSNTARVPHQDSIYKSPCIVSRYQSGDEESNSYRCGDRLLNRRHILV
jgi:hypothetical protein